MSAVCCLSSPVFVPDVVYYAELIIWKCSPGKVSDGKGCGGRKDKVTGMPDARGTVWAQGRRRGLCFTSAGTLKWFYLLKTGSFECAQALCALRTRLWANPLRLWASKLPSDRQKAAGAKSRKKTLQAWTMKRSCTAWVSDFSSAQHR